MRFFIYLFSAVLLLVSCGGKSDSANGPVSDSVVVPDSATLARMQQEAEQARKDSLVAAALQGDSIKEKHIVVDKSSLMLFLREDGKTIKSYPVCVGSGIGQKKRQGDHKTPEGTYKIRSIEDARGYLHDFHDGKGPVKGAYGNWFFRLNTPQSTHIGIHGTLFPESMGKRESDGCIRMRNEDLDELHGHVFKGMTVVINPDKL